MDPVLGVLIDAGIALLFAHASWHKWRDRDRFAATVVAYRILPSRIAPAAGYGIPLAEALIAGLLLVPATRQVAAVAGAGLLLSYAMGISANLFRGRTGLDCGCTGPADRRPIAAWMVWRNALLAVPLLATTAPWAVRPLGAIDALTVGAGIVAAALVYAAVDRLLGQVMPRTAALRRGL